MSALAKLSEAYHNPVAAAQEHKKSGGRVIAFVCDNVPIELILAAGAFPLRVHGSPARRSRSSERLIDPLFPPDLTHRPAFASSMIDMILDGSLDFVDALIVPNNRAAVHMIPRQMADLTKFRDIRTPEIWFLDKAWASGEEARSYNENEIRALHRRLSDWSGTAVHSDAVAEAIEDNGAAGQAVSAIQLRRRTDQPIAGSTALEMIGARWSLLPRDYAAAVGESLSGELAAGNGPKLYLGGSPVDSPEFYRLVEELGATLIEEDHCWGARSTEAPLDLDGDPIAALAKRFHDFPACTLRVPFERTIDANLSRAKAARCDGAIFRVAAKDDVQMWETPEQVQAFRSAGIPSLHLRTQPYEVATSEEGKDQVARFIAEVAR